MPLAYKKDLINVWSMLKIINSWVQNTEQFIDYIDCYMIYDISNIKKNVIT